ncbi:hypothetical protein BV898_20326, partial [Hypsibius exemplaris]
SPPAVDIQAAHPRGTARQTARFSSRPAFDVFGSDDGSPILKTEEFKVWPDTHDDDDASDEDGDEDFGLLDPVEVESDTDGQPGEPVELQEKALSLVVEKENDHPVWGLWSLWTPCSRTCNGGTRRRVRKCIRGTCQVGVEEDQYEDCSDTPGCQDEIHQLEEPLTTEDPNMLMAR